MKAYFSKTVRLTDRIGEYITVCEVSRDYDGPVALCKGDPTAQAAEQQQSQFDNQLMNIFQAQYGKQSAITDYLTKNMESMVGQGGQGMSADALAAARTSATDNLSNQFQGAQRAVNATEQRGLPSGVNAQVSGSMMAQEAEQQAASQNQITMQNEQLKQANYWNSINVLSGTGSMINPLGYSNNATSGTGAVADASKAVTAANGPGIGSVLGSVLGGAGASLINANPKGIFNWEEIWLQTHRTQQEHSQAR